MSSNRTERVAWWLWLTLLVVLPVTSFPPISEAFGRSTVAPLAAIPLLGLLIISVIPRIIKERELPQLASPLLVFLGFVLLSTAVGLFIPVEGFKNQTALGREARALITLGVGLGFFLSAVMMPRSENRMRGSLVALTAGGAVALAWSFIQEAFLLASDPATFRQFNELHRLISIRDLVPDRISGLAYEPSWFGNQLAVLYIPMWLGSVVVGYSAFRLRRGVITVELVLAVLGAVALLLARTRISILSFSLVAGALILFLFWQIGGKLAKSSRGGLPLHRLAILGAGIFFIGALGLGFVIGAQNLDPRLRRVATIYNELPQIRSEHPYELGLELANRASFAERVVYWMAAWQVFLENPFAGVGPGNSGLLFEESIPAYGYRLTEIQTVLAADNAIFPNPKSLWIRLLAETGIIGFAAFVTWLITVMAGALNLRISRSLLLRALGFAGVLMLIAQVIEGFNIDTFALPQLWIIPGLVGAGAVLLKRLEHAS